MPKPTKSAQRPVPQRGPCIAIVGGGMVGAVQALLLSQNVPSVSITLYDKSHSSPSKRASFDERSTALAPTTQRCFQKLGLWPSIEEHATPIHRVCASDKGHAGMTVLDERDNEGSALGYVVMNKGLGQVVLDAVAASPTISEVIAGVDRVIPKQQGSELQFSRDSGVKEPSKHYDLVIIADGAHSSLRQQLGISVERTDYNQCALVANVRHELPHECTAYERFRSTGPIALLPLGGNARSHESTLVWTCSPEGANNLLQMTEAERLHVLQEDFGFRLGYFQAMSTPASYPLSLIVANEQARSGIVLLGNAAHFLHPVAGQGFNLSVRDMLRLTLTLQRAVSCDQHVGDLAVLQQYVQQQQADQHNTIKMSHSFSRIFGATQFSAQLLRTVGMLTIETNPLLRALFIDFLSGKAQPQSLL